MKTTTNLIKGIFLLTVNFTILSTQVLAAGQPDINRGAKAWANTCTRCHNMRQPNEFADNVWEPIVLHMRLRSGITGAMARDILAFLQSSNFTPIKVSASSKPSTVSLNQSTSSGLTAQSGEAIFGKTCIACHGANGKGVIPGVPDLRSRLSKVDGVLLQHIKDGFQSPGSIMAMPPRGGNPDLTDAELNNVLMYMHEKFSR